MAVPGQTSKHDFPVLRRPASALLAMTVTGASHQSCSHLLKGPSLPLGLPPHSTLSHSHFR
eukprot:1139789-Prorocentrum_minimum.AAC.3